MWEYNYPVSKENELYHHGVLGMRWGVRKYQKKDGSLTSLGKKRRAEGKFGGGGDPAVKKKSTSKNEVEKKSSSKKKETDGMSDNELKDRVGNLEKNEQRKSKSISEMSDQELQRTVNRIRLEQEYHRLNPEKISVGKRFTTKVVNDVIVPAAVEIGKNALKSVATSQIEKHTGISMSGGKKKDKKKDD